MIYSISIQPKKVFGNLHDKKETMGYFGGSTKTPHHLPLSRAIPRELQSVHARVDPVGEIRFAKQAQQTVKPGWFLDDNRKANPQLE
jgi:hypothetical protein